ncbi:MAG: hypothetical protein SFV19_04555 [Rhodospirillaceae bacterium]|nr:hypothetical protein [Rhodospirillaceae bacterium]
MTRFNALIVGFWLAAQTLLLVAPTFAQAPSETAADPWAPLRPLVGRWEGTSEGEPGRGQSTRSYQFVLDGRFLEGENTAVYPPQEKNPKGETHRDRSIYSYDRARKALVLRQFHTEGFVNTYVEDPQSAPGALVFVSEGIENIPPGYRARETYVFDGRDSLVETFEIAEPGKDFAVYSRARLTRVGGGTANGAAP